MCAVIPVLVRNDYLQSKRDSFKRRYNSTIDKIDAFFYKQSAIRQSAIISDKITNAQAQALAELKKKSKEVRKNLEIMCILKL